MKQPVPQAASLDPSHYSVLFSLVTLHLSSLTTRHSSLRITSPFSLLTSHFPLLPSPFSLPRGGRPSLPATRDGRRVPLRHCRPPAAYPPCSRFAGKIMRAFTRSQFSEKSVSGAAVRRVDSEPRLCFDQVVHWEAATVWGRRFSRRFPACRRAFKAAGSDTAPRNSSINPSRSWIWSGVMISASGAV